MDIKVYEVMSRKFEKEILSAYIEKDNKKIQELEPFVYQPIELVYDEEGIEKTVKTEPCCNMIRFSVNEEGSYKLCVIFADNTDIAQSYTAKGYYGKGYIRINKNDKRYFEYTTGEPCFVMGVNLAFPRRIPVSNQTEFGLSNDVAFMGLRQYERWLKSCSENGINMARIWIGHEYFSPDTRDATVYDYPQFSKLDMLVDLARKYNIRLKLTFEQFRWFDFDETDTSNISRHFNKVLYLDEKKCDSARNWILEDEWKNAWLNKIGEYAKRYACDTTVFAFELWNEMNCVGLGEGVSFSDIVKWNEEMIPRIQSMFPNHIVLNSLGSLDCDDAQKMYEKFPWDIIGVKQMHRYLDQGAKYEDTTKNPIDVVRCGMKRIHDGKMPFIVAEVGACNNCHSGEFKYYSVDDMGLIFVDCVYTPVFFGSASCGNIWHWDERYIESKKLYRYFKPLADMTADIDFGKEDFQGYDLSNDEIYLFLLKGKNHTLGFARNKTASWQNLLRDMNAVVSCSDFVFETDGKIVRKYPVWDEDTTKVTIENGKLILSDILYGTIFKIDN